MKQIIFQDANFGGLRNLLFSNEQETCAILLAVEHKSKCGSRYIVREHYIVPPSQYHHRTEVAAVVAPDFLVPIVRRAREELLSVIFTHTHPGKAARAAFSITDNEGERHLRKFVYSRCPNVDHFAMVLAETECAARVLGEVEPARVITLGASRRELTQPNLEKSEQLIWDRQERVFGSSGQGVLRNLEVAVVGCGGTGSIVCEQLAHLGVRSLTLVDPDHIEPTNLNRVVGAGVSDVGRRKIEVAAESVRRLGFGTSVKIIEGNILDSGVGAAILSADAVFSCTDSHGSRAFLNQLSYQYLIPVFDIGVAIGAELGNTTHITGRTQMLSPGLGCLVCAQALDWTQVRQDFQSEDEKKLNPYIVGHADPQPAVITINGIISSLATTMFMAAMTETPANARLQYYNGITGTVRAALVQPQPGCVVCSDAGALSQAGRWPLPTRA